MHPSRGSEYPDHRGMAKTEIPAKRVSMPQSVPVLLDIFQAHPRLRPSRHRRSRHDFLRLQNARRHVEASYSIAILQLPSSIWHRRVTVGAKDWSLFDHRTLGVLGRADITLLLPGGQFLAAVPLALSAQIAAIVETERTVLCSGTQNYSANYHRSRGTAAYARTMFGPANGPLKASSLTIRLLKVSLRRGHVAAPN